MRVCFCCAAVMSSSSFVCFGEARPSHSVTLQSESVVLQTSLLEVLMVWPECNQKNGTISWTCYFRNSENRFFCCITNLNIGLLNPTAKNYLHRPVISGKNVISFDFTHNVTNTLTLNLLFGGQIISSEPRSCRGEWHKANGANKWCQTM